MRGLGFCVVVFGVFFVCVCLIGFFPLCMCRVGRLFDK